MSVVATSDFPEGIEAPARRVVLVTPSDTDELANVTLGISMAVAGALKITPLVGDAVVIPSGALAAGVIHRIHAKQIWSTGTAATGIVAYS